MEPEINMIFPESQINISHDLNSQFFLIQKGYGQFKHLHVTLSI